MPRSISSLHSRTATTSSSPLSSVFPPIRTPSGSTTGSISTNNSEPFIHADALDSTIQWIPSYYLDDSTTQDSTTRISRRNALVILTPTSSVSLSKVDLLPDRLRRSIRASDLQPFLKGRLLAMVNMFLHMSRQLFPSSHILRGDVARDVENLAMDICEFLDIVLEKLARRLDAATSAKDQLSGYDLADEVPLEEVVRWIDIIDGLHKPTHVEAKIFGRMATLYEEYVYMPFLQLHRQEPEHNMYLLLDVFLDAIFIRLRSIVADATRADNLVLEVEKTLDAAALVHAKKVPRGHVPSYSTPVACNPRVMGLRQRENTL